MNMLTPTEAAVKLKCSRNKIYKLIEHTNMPKIKIGGRYLIPEEELNRWVKNNLGNCITI